MASAGSGASADEREVKAKPAASLPSLHPTTIAHIAFIDRRGGRPRPNENWRLRIRHDLPTGRAKRFQRFSNSGKYRITHRMMVVCDTATPRSAWSRRGCDLAWQDELQSRVQRLGDARLATQGRVLEDQHAALGLLCGDQSGRPPAPLRALRRSARARARPACGAARARAHPILPTAVSCSAGRCARSRRGAVWSCPCLLRAAHGGNVVPVDGANDWRRDIISQNDCRKYCPSLIRM